MKSMNRSIQSLLTSAVLLAIAAGNVDSVRGGEMTLAPAKMPVGKSPLPTLDEDELEWHFGIAAWLPWISGDIIVPVSIGFDQLVKHLDFYVPIEGGIRKGRWGLDSHLIWMKVSGTDNELSGGLLNSVSLDIKLLRADLIGYYRLAKWDEGESFLDVGAGARVVWVDLKLGITKNQGNIATLKEELKSNGVDVGDVDAPRNYSDSEGWVDPLVMLRLRQKLGDKLFFQIYGDIGGFGISAQLDWMVEAGLTYQITDSMSAAIGFRYWNVDYESGSFLFDVDIYGPVVGIGWTF
jgi:hypothetical protein